VFRRYSSLATCESVDEALRTLLADGQENISAESVKRIRDVSTLWTLRDVEIPAVNLSAFDRLCAAGENAGELRCESTAGEGGS